MRHPDAGEVGHRQTNLIVARALPWLTAVEACADDDDHQPLPADRAEEPPQLPPQDHAGVWVIA
jgi:hypothetical protein